MGLTQKPIPKPKYKKGSYEGKDGSVYDKRWMDGTLYYLFVSEGDNSGNWVRSDKVTLVIPAPEDKLPGTPYISREGLSAKFTVCGVCGGDATICDGC